MIFGALGGGVYPLPPAVEIETQLPIYAATPAHVGFVAVKTSTVAVEPSIESDEPPVNPGSTCTSWVLPAARLTTTMPPAFAPSDGSVITTVRVVATTFTVTLPEVIE